MKKNLVMKPSIEKGKRNKSELYQDIVGELGEVRKLKLRLAEIEGIISSGSLLHRGVSLVQRDLASAEIGLKRLMVLARQD